MTFSHGRQQPDEGNVPESEALTSPPNSELLLNATRSQKRRGPVGVSIWVSPRTGEEKGQRVDQEGIAP